MPLIVPLSLHLPTASLLENEQYDSIQGTKDYVDLLKPKTSLPHIKKGFQRLLREKVYQTLEKQHFYWYRIQNKEAVFSGFLCGLDAKSIRPDKISTHEAVLQKRVKLFSNYLKKTHLQAEPLLLIHEDNAFATACNNTITQKPPSFHFQLNQSIHEIWILSAQVQQALVEFAKKTTPFHLADGHHRLASSLQLAKDAKTPFPIQAFVLAKDQIVTGSFIWCIKKYLTQEKLVPLLHHLHTPTTEVSSNTLKIVMGNEHFNCCLDASENPAVFAFEKLLGFSTQKAIDLRNYIDYFPYTTSIPEDFMKKAAPYLLKIQLPPFSEEAVIASVKKNQKLPPKSSYMLPKIPTGLLISPI